MGTLSALFDNETMKKICNEFTRLGDRCYLENIGAALYPQCLLRKVNEDLMSNIYMNPHTDKYTKDCVEQVRHLILKHFNTDSSEYTVIFTAGTTQSLKLVVESFQFSNDSEDVLNCGSYVYLRDNHTSVLGLREIAADKNADIIHLGHEDFLKSVYEYRAVPFNWREKYKNEGNTLLVYPAQSNFNGFKYPTDCIDKLKEGCLNSYIRRNLCKTNCNWYVLLDSASYVSTNKLDLRKVQPDFVCLSFYKMFGFPTGLGALIVKNSSVNVLCDKKYFGGGTVDIVLSSEDYHVKRSEIYERFEDGTIAFLSILALKHAFDSLHYLIPKLINNDIMETISNHTFLLAKDFYNQLKDLKHKNGANVSVLYMDSDFSDIKKQGAIVTFNLLRDDGTYIGYSEFQHMADLFNISIRTGCFCNSGSCQRHLEATNKEIKDMYKAGHKCGDEVDLVNGKPTGAVRASFAYYNTFQDVDKLIIMICRCFIKSKYVSPKRNVSKLLVTPEIERKNGISNTFLTRKHNSIIENEFKIETYGNSKAVLAEIAIYPVKSCGAFKVKNAWLIGPKGFEYDRAWMIVKDNGVCLTQKQAANMCLIRPVIDLKRDVMILHCKGMEPMSVPLDVSYHADYEVPICQSKVCTDTVKAYDCGDTASNWVSLALGISYLRLIRQSDCDKRVQKKSNTSEEKKQLSLSNQAQFLLVNKATVRWLGDMISDESFVDTTDQLTDRFRGNIIVDTDQELVEREWQRVVIGKHEFKVDGPCSRCQMVCIDQETGDKTVEPLRTIAEQFGGKVRFGIYLSYVGTVDGSTDVILKNGLPVEAFSNDDDISR